MRWLGARRVGPQATYLETLRANCLWAGAGLCRRSVNCATTHVCIPNFHPSQQRKKPGRKVTGGPLSPQSNLIKPHQWQIPVSLPRIISTRYHAPPFGLVCNILDFFRASHRPGAHGHEARACPMGVSIDASATPAGPLGWRLGQPRTSTY